MFPVRQSHESLSLSLSLSLFLAVRSDYLCPILDDWWVSGGPQSRRVTVLHSTDKLRPMADHKYTADDV